jgi:mannose-6-phosphate isomerase-like protein (cupin superfamily)
MPYISHIIKQTEENQNFRKVLFTGEKSQLVVMTIPPQGEIGEETHPHVEQILFILNGSGKAVLDGEETAIGAGDAVVVTPGVKHNIINSGLEALKVYTIYTPPNHIDGRIHITKTEADADTEDEAFGEKIQ